MEVELHFLALRPGHSSLGAEESRSSFEALMRLAGTSGNQNLGDFVERCKAGGRGGEMLRTVGHVACCTELLFIWKARAAWWDTLTLLVAPLKLKSG